MGGVASSIGDGTYLPSKALEKYQTLPEEVCKTARSAVIGGSGVTVAGQERFSVKTPFGFVVNLSFLDEARQVLFLNRHLCTHVDSSTGEVRYAPPHEVNYRAMVWCLHLCSVKRVVALSSTGTLHPKDIPVGSVVMPDDFYMTKPDPMTFWPHPAMGTFAADAENGQVGRIHFAPAIKEDTAWTGLRAQVQKMLNPVLSAPACEKLHMGRGQTRETWPCHWTQDSSVEDPPSVYVNTIGPRFETRAEIRSYRDLGGSVVGMTCGYEWMLCSELMLPYVLVSVVDNACNGLSTYPGGALQEYLDHKGSITEVTAALIQALVTGLGAQSES